MRKWALGLGVAVIAGAALAPLATRAQTAPSPTTRALRSPGAFASIRDSAARSESEFGRRIFSASSLKQPLAAVDSGRGDLNHERNLVVAGVTYQM